MMRRRFAIVAVALIACGKQPEAPPASKPPTPPAATTQPTSGDLTRARGTAGPFIRAAQSLSIDPKTRDSVERIAARLEARATSERVREAASALLEDVRPQILAGTIDTTKLASRFDEIAKSSQAREDEQAQALDDLHAALSPKDRRAVADAVAEAIAGARKEMRAPRHLSPNERAAAISERLELDPTQRESVEKIFAELDHDDSAKEWAVANQRVDAIIEGFKGERFEAKSLDGIANSGEEARAIVMRNMQELARIAPILDEAQRKKLSERMR